MTYDRAEQALSRARRDYHRAVSALMNAETPRAQQRHARRARIAEKRIREAQQDLARLPDLREREAA